MTMIWDEARAISRFLSLVEGSIFFAYCIEYIELRPLELSIGKPNYSSSPDKSGSNSLYA
jgi:hypothetical protein